MPTLTANEDAMPDLKAPSRRTLRERWIRRYQGYFGDPPTLGQYRSGEITFGELYRQAMKAAEDMTTEASRIEAEAFSQRDERHV